MLHVRSILKQDLEIICSFPQSKEELFYFFPKAVHPLTPEQLQHAIGQRSDSTVVVQDNTVVGFANFYRWTAGTCCIGNVIVAPVARGQGVAKFLIRAMISLAEQKHFATVIQVSCFNQNTEGLLLYKALGFEPVDMEERKYIDGKRIVLIHMQYRTPKTQLPRHTPPSSGE
ncbi:GNAT family N-acetyltransferase [uncultured Desulfobacter sp.]|uniref:GNAT family N-acetyltransferase n=1 Tax=uncultured Desulfobacter sp. TaxID=240139 RepID=UPI002AAAC2AD|nr:GNAT family N-acetyltransferase [uncultured Desulfobacter sp.]